MTIKDVKPTAGYLLIEPNEAVKKTISGIVLPDSHDEKPQMGQVLAVGADEILENNTKRPAPCKIGDIVVYKKWGGNEFKIENKEYMFIKFEDVMAVTA